MALVFKDLDVQWHVGNPLLVKTAQSLAPGTRIELFDFDATKIGGDFVRWVSAFKSPTPISWQGNTYVPLPIEAEGFEVTGTGTIPRPTLRISNVLLVPGAIINELGDPLGAVVTRWVTFEKFLDGESDADAHQHFLPQIFTVERKITQNKVFVQFELSSAIDQEGRLLPRRQAVRDTCSHVYRTWDPSLDGGAGGFNYAGVNCPYVGFDDPDPLRAGPFYDLNDIEVPNPEDDVCAKRLISCKKRFHVTPARAIEFGLAEARQPLPYWGFPALAKIKR